MNAPGAADLRGQISAVIEAGAGLWQAPAEARAAWLGRAFAALSGADAALRKSLVAELPRSTGLSAQMITWALDSTLATLSTETLLALQRSAPLPGPRMRLARPGKLCVVVLAGNVFTAAARALAIPLLFGIPVVAKTASDDEGFVRALHTALIRADPALARAFDHVSLESADDARAQLLFERADIVSVFGSDHTLNTIRGQLGASVSFIGHGHGLGAAFIDRAALSDEAQARRAARALALDVAAYDQRGCMSPLVAWVVEGEPVTGQDFARFVFEALGVLGAQLPRGPVPIASASAQLSFRGIAALHGTLFEGDGYAVTYEGKAPLRIGPGYRNLQVLDSAAGAGLSEQLAPLGVHLKCLGIAGVEDQAALIDSLPARVAPRVCALGTMQKPRLDALQDGVPAWEGLLRYVEQDP